MSEVKRAALVFALFPTILVGASCQGKTPQPVQVVQPAMTYAQSSVVACLRDMSLAFESLQHREFTKPLNQFPALTGSVLVTASPSETNPQAKATIDTVQLFFFKSAPAAIQAQADLAQFYVYFHGPFAYLRYLRQVPRNAAALDSIERLNPKASDQTLNRCLRPP
jgi:hypothetical protein